MSIADDYQKVKTTLERLRQDQEQTKTTLRVKLSACISQEGSVMNLRDSVDNGLPELSSLPRRLTIVISTKDYVRNSRDLHVALKDVEQATREAKEATQKNDDERFERALETACNSLSSCTMLEAKMKPIPLQLQGTRMEAFADELAKRLEKCQKELEQSCDESVIIALQSCGWPPSFASPSDDPPLPNFWTVLVSENHSAFAKLESALIKLTRLQQSMDGRTISGQVLWFMKRIVDPLEARLRLHFASDRGTADLSKPEWLLTTATKIIQRHSLGMQYFQSVLTACHLDGLFDLEIEFMRCIQLSVQVILTQFHLPKLLELGSGALWLSWTENSKKFDKDIMDMIGISHEAGALWYQYLESGTINAFFQEKDWLVAWTTSEIDDAVHQIDEIMLRPRAWENRSLNGTAVFNEEIWPPRFAEDIWNVFVTVVQKCEGLPKERIETWLKKVGKAFLMDFGRRLSTNAKSTEAFKELLQPNRAQKVCAVICAANYFIHNITEWNELDIQSDVTANQIRSIFEKETGNFTAFRKEWCMKIAKEIASQFNSELYNYKTNLHVFGQDQPEIGEQNATASFIPAVMRLKESLELISGMLDAICFREVWKAVTYGVVRILFNDVITEAKFTLSGARQLQYDLCVLMDAFSPYTRRPHTHFKELHEAALLLTYPAESATYIHQQLLADPNDATCGQYLRDCGVHSLQPDQIICILEERLNY